MPWLQEILDNMPAAGKTVIFEFRSTVATDERSSMSVVAFHCSSSSSMPIDPWEQKKHGSTWCT